MNNFGTDPGFDPKPFGDKPKPGDLPPGWGENRYPWCGGRGTKPCCIKGVTTMNALTFTYVKANGQTQDWNTPSPVLPNPKVPDDIAHGDQIDVTIVSKATSYSWCSNVNCKGACRMGADLHRILDLPKAGDPGWFAGNCEAYCDLINSLYYGGGGALNSTGLNTSTYTTQTAYKAGCCRKWNYGKSAFGGTAEKTITLSIIVDVTDPLPKDVDDKFDKNWPSGYPKLDKDDPDIQFEVIMSKVHDAIADAWKSPKDSGIAPPPCPV